MQVAENVVSLKQKDEKRAEDKARKEGNQKIAETKVAKRLTDLSKKIEDLKVAQVRTEYEIGRCLNEIAADDLWRADGDFKSFHAFVQSRFGFTRQTAYAYMAIVEKFTREEASTIPIGALRLLVTIPDDGDRKKLVEMVQKEKPTFRELADTVKANRVEAGLKTDRKGLENTVLVSSRLKVGVVTEFKWKEARGKAGSKKRIASFNIGEATFILEDLGDDGCILRLAPVTGEG